MLQDALAGFSLGLSLILVIGPQNAFVLRQGLRHEHVFAVALTCAVSDAVLIATGVAGFGWIADMIGWLSHAFALGGAAFLIVYGAMNAWRALTHNEALRPADRGTASLKRAVLTCLALTWLNPHVYLDTVMLMGSISTRYQHPLGFGVGAATASFVFFFSLGYGSRNLAAVFAQPIAWRILDGVVAIVMWIVAYKLLTTW